MATDGDPSIATPRIWVGLHVLADDDTRWPIDPVEQARAACEGGASAVQLRAKHAADARILEWGRAIRELTRASGARFVVNDRFDLALAVEADAVHLGQEDLSPSDLPPNARARLAIGRSTHTLEQALRALEEGVDYIAFGPVFGTRSKRSEYEERGLARLAEVSRRIAPRPLVAIGGITLQNLSAVLAAGAAGAAVISAVAAAPIPALAVERLAQAWKDRGAALAERA